MTWREWVLLAIVAAFAAIIVWLLRRRPRPTAREGARRILVPFVGRLARLGRGVGPVYNPPEVRDSPTLRKVVCTSKRVTTRCGRGTSAWSSN